MVTLFSFTEDLMTDDTNVFDPNQGIDFTFITQDGSVERKMRPAKMIPFFNGVKTLISKHSKLITKSLEEIDEQRKKEAGLELDRVQEEVKKQQKRLEKYKNLSDEKFNKLSPEEVEEFTSICNQLNDLDDRVEEITEPTFGIQIENILAVIVSQGSDVLLDIVQLIYQDKGITQDMVDNLTIPMMRKIFEDFKKLNDIDYLLKNPLLQKLINRVQPLASGA